MCWVGGGCWREQRLRWWNAQAPLLAKAERAPTHGWPSAHRRRWQDGRMAPALPRFAVVLSVCARASRRSSQCCARCPHGENTAALFFRGAPPLAPDGFMCFRRFHPPVRPARTLSSARPAHDLARTAACVGWTVPSITLPKEDPPPGIAQRTPDGERLQPAQQRLARPSALNLFPLALCRGPHCVSRAAPPRSARRDCSCKQSPRPGDQLLRGRGPFSPSYSFAAPGSPLSKTLSSICTARFGGESTPASFLQSAVAHRIAARHRRKICTRHAPPPWPLSPVPATCLGVRRRLHTRCVNAAAMCFNIHARDRPLGSAVVCSELFIARADCLFPPLHHAAVKA